MVAQKIACREDQIVEIEQRGRPLVFAEMIEHGADLFDQLGEDAARDILGERLPCDTTCRISCFSCEIEPLAICFGETFAFGCLDPFALLLER